MSTYIYRCLECQLDFEIQQSINDSPGAKCPKCGKKITHRLIQLPYVVFKGDGWASKEIK